MRPFLAAALLATSVLTVGTARGSCHPTASPRPRIVAYFTSWGVYDRGFRVQDIDVSRLTHVNYAFANVDGTTLTATLGDPWADVDMDYPGDCPDPGCLRGHFHQLELLKQRAPHLRVLISIGGWTWSDLFSDVALSAASRRRFVQSAIDLFILGRFGAPYGDHPGIFDGIDIDWEFPVSGGLVPGRPADRHDFTLLMQEFRTQLDALTLVTGKPYELSIAAGAGSADIANLEVPQLASALDHVNLMAYDLHGAWDGETGFNAALHVATGDPSSAAADLNVEGVVRNYLAAGLPADQLVVGMPFYGKSFAGVTNANDGLWQPSTGDGPGLYEAGSVDYTEVVATYLGSMTRFWQAEAQVPWLFDGSVFISYDDPQSIAAKAAWVGQQGLGGAMVWELSADLHGVPAPAGSLLEALASSLCPSVPGRIVDLRVARDGADLLFSWTPDVEAVGGYHLYETNVHTECGTMRDTAPGYDAFMTTPATTMMPVRFTNGVAAGLTYYQVLGVAGDGVMEGPN